MIIHIATFFMTTCYGAVLTQPGAVKDERKCVIGHKKYGGREINWHNEFIKDSVFLYSLLLRDAFDGDKAKLEKHYITHADKTIHDRYVLCCKKAVENVVNIKVYTDRKIIFKPKRPKTIIHTMGCELIMYFLLSLEFVTECSVPPIEHGLFKAISSKISEIFLVIKDDLIQEYTKISDDWYSKSMSCSQKADNNQLRKIQRETTRHRDYRSASFYSKLHYFENENKLCNTSKQMIEERLCIFAFQRVVYKHFNQFAKYIALKPTQHFNFQKMNTMFDVHLFEKRKALLIEKEKRFTVEKEIQLNMDLKRMTLRNRKSFICDRMEIIN